MRAISLRGVRGKLVHAAPEVPSDATEMKTLCGKNFEGWRIVDESMTCVKCLNKLLKSRGGIKHE